MKNFFYLNTPADFPDEIKENKISWGRHRFLPNKMVIILHCFLKLLYIKHGEYLSYLSLQNLLKDMISSGISSFGFEFRILLK
jgi:hypothetical protein